MSDEVLDGQRATRTLRPEAKYIGLAAIRDVVSAFYTQARRDPVLGPRFATVRDWVDHEARLTHFWWVALGGRAYAAYRYRVVERHRTAGVTEDDLQRWFTLFGTCVRQRLPGPYAELWLRRARAMGRVLTQVAGKPT